MVHGSLRAERAQVNGKLWLFASKKDIIRVSPPPEYQESYIMKLSITLLTMILGIGLTHPAGADSLLQRSPADVQRDLTSRPATVLDFFEVQPGWKVLDLFAGDGYYSELLAQRVGPTGKVYLHNNQAYMGLARNLRARLNNNRLPNVEVYIREVNDINLPSDSLDMVMLVMAYHDAYFTQNGWTVNAEGLFRTVHRILKPGGTLAVIDHHATTGSGSAHAQDLHRIDADFARRDITGRGFEFVAASDALNNPTDQLHRSVFDPEVRGQTSRFVFRFSKRAL